jgi:hypothetical protein
VHRGLLFRVERVHLNPPKQPAYCNIDRFEVLPFPPWRKVVAAPIRSKSVKVRFGHALENMHPHPYPLWLRRRAHSPACPICAQSVHSTRSPKFKLRHYQHQAPLPPKTKLRSPCKPRAIQRSGRGRTSRNDRRAPSGRRGGRNPIASGTIQDPPLRPGKCGSISGQLTFPRYTLMRFVHALDAIFELTAVVRKLLSHLIDAARQRPIAIINRNHVLIR